MLPGNTNSVNHKEWGCQSVYGLIHSEPNIKLIDFIFERLIGSHATAETAHGNWHERNRRIQDIELAIKNSSSGLKE